MSLFDEVLEELQSRGEVWGPNKNSEYYTFCIFHPDQRRPNLHIHPQKGFYCFACGAKGSIKKLASEVGTSSPSQRLNQAQAILKLTVKRRLNPNTLTHFGIQAEGKKQAWRYPVEGGYRYKAFDPLAKRKYWHDKGVQNQLYGLSDIANGTEEIWLVNGEPAVWQCWQAGIPAVCGIYGEGQLPDDGISQLKDKGIERINLCFDQDDTGDRAAKLVWSKLKQDFEVSVRILPEDLGKGGDIGDLFTRLQGDPTKFVQELKALPEADTEGWERQSLKFQIEETRSLPKERMPAFKRRQLISEAIIADLESGGFLVAADGNYYWFYDKQKRLFPLNAPYFLSLLEDWYGINASETEYKYLAEALRTEAELHGKRSGVYQFARYQDRKLYISRFDGQVYRLNGEEIELIPNGEDELLFYDDPDWEPYEYLGPDLTPQYLYPLLIEPINFSSQDVRMTPEEQMTLWQLWLYSIFFESLLPTKPILLFLGEKGSGKTSTLRWVLKWLFGSKADVHSLAKEKEDAFIAIVTSSYLAAFDNVDARIPWFNDHLAALATGTSISLRRLYTTNVKVTYHPKVFLTLTSRTPQFKRDDVVDRLLLFRVDRIQSFKSERKLLEERLKARNELWTEVLNDLNQIVKALQEDKETLTGSYRLADWAELAWKITKTQGAERSFQNAVKKLEVERSAFLLENDPLYFGLDIWLDNPVNEGRELDIQGLFSELRQACESNSINWSYDNTRSLAQRIARVKDNLKDFFDVEIKRKRKGGPHKIYSFKRKS